MAAFGEVEPVLTSLRTDPKTTVRLRGNLQLRKHVHGTRTTVLWFEGSDDTTWLAWSATM